MKLSMCVLTAALVLGTSGAMAADRSSERAPVSQSKAKDALESAKKDAEEWRTAWASLTEQERTTLQGAFTNAVDAVKNLTPTQKAKIRSAASAVASALVAYGKSLTPDQRKELAAKLTDAAKAYGALTADQKQAYLSALAVRGPHEQGRVLLSLAPDAKGRSVWSDAEAGAQADAGETATGRIVGPSRAPLPFPLPAEGSAPRLGADDLRALALTGPAATPQGDARSRAPSAPAPLPSAPLAPLVSAPARAAPPAPLAPLVSTPALCSRFHSGNDARVEAT